MPSEPLEGMISATILKLAKQRFLTRGLGRGTDDQPQSKQNTEAEMETGGSSLLSDEGHQLNEDEQEAAIAMDTDGFVPVVSADDDLSYELLRPAARHILQKLDQTLTLLHNVRVVGASYLTESSATSAADNSGSDDGSTVSRGHSMRSRSSGTDGRGTRKVQVSAASRTQSPQRSTSRRGRPRKQHTPREGETERMMMARVAREGHRRMPIFLDDDTAEEKKVFDSTNEAAENKAEKRKKKKTAARRESEPRPGENRHEMLTRIARERHRALPVFADDTDDDYDDSSEGKEGSSRRSSARPTSRGSVRDAKVERPNRQHLRDWSDVLGAAALAGFPPEAIHRATQRCAELFGQSMTFHTLTESPAASRGGGLLTTLYPTKQPADLSSDTDDSAPDANQVRAVLSRQSSVAPHDSSSRDQEGRVAAKRRRVKSPPASQTSRPGRFYCSVAKCVRAVQGFSRWRNLQRHLRLVHSVMLKESRRSGDEEKGDVGQDGEDIDGAVHRDGFLQPIALQRGWRERSRSRSRTGLDTDEEPSLAIRPRGVSSSSRGN